MQNDLPLQGDVRQALIEQARAGHPTTYRDLANRLNLAPPQTIHRLTVALEGLMAQDAAAGRPLLAALCVSRLQPGIPARGFFQTAAQLGLFFGDPESAEADAFHARELQRALAFYGG